MQAPLPTTHTPGRVAHQSLGTVPNSQLTQSMCNSHSMSPMSQPAMVILRGQVSSSVGCALDSPMNPQPL